MTLSAPNNSNNKHNTKTNMNTAELISELMNGLTVTRQKLEAVRSDLAIGIIEQRGLRIVANEPGGDLRIAVGVKQDGKTVLGFAHVATVKAGDMLQFSRDDDEAFLKNVAEQYAKLGATQKDALRNVRFESKRFVNAAIEAELAAQVEAVEETVAKLKSAVLPMED